MQPLNQQPARLRIGKASWVVMVVGPIPLIQGDAAYRTGSVVFASGDDLTSASEADGSVDIVFEDETWEVKVDFSKAGDFNDCPFRETQPPARRS